MRSVSLTLMGVILVATNSVRAAATIEPGPFAIPTFHCLGIYWSPAGGNTNKNVLVRYRRHGDAIGREGLPMRYNPISNTDEDLTDYRGSIVNLKPATAYDVELKLSDGSATTNLVATTWSESFSSTSYAVAGLR